MKKTYILCYNGFMAVGYSYLLCCLVISLVEVLISDGDVDVYKDVGQAISLLQGVMVLDVVHPLLRLAKGSPATSAVQLSGRLIGYFMILNCEPRLHQSSSVLVLFLAHSAIESIRYTFYCLQWLSIDLYALRWLRYSAWIVLYPTGMLTEVYIGITAAPYFAETGHWSIFLPNNFNISFDFPNFIRLGLCCVAPLANPYLLKHMWRQRGKALKK